MGRVCEVSGCGGLSCLFEEGEWGEWGEYTAMSKVWAPTLFYTKTCNFLKESNFFSRL